MSNKNDAIEELLDDIKRYARLYGLATSSPTAGVEVQLRQESLLAFSNIRDSLYHMHEDVSDIARAQAEK